MANELRKEELLYLQVHGLRVQAPEALNQAMEQAISAMRLGLYAESAGELSEAEAEVLRSGGAVLEEQPGPDPMAEAAAEFGALLSTSLTIEGPVGEDEACIVSGSEGATLEKVGRGFRLVDGAPLAQHVGPHEHAVCVAMVHEGDCRCRDR